MPLASKRQWLVTSNSEHEGPRRPVFRASAAPLARSGSESPSWPPHGGHKSTRQHSGASRGVSSGRKHWQRQLSESPSREAAVRCDRGGGSGAQVIFVVDSDADEELSHCPKVLYIDLALSDLTLHGNLRGSEPRNRHTAYERRGADPSRIRAALQNGSCCANQCGPRLARKCEAKLIDVMTFWHLHMSATERCFLIQNMYDAGDTDGDGLGAKSRRKWRLCGEDVCKLAFVTISGTSSRALYHMTKGISSSLLRQVAPRARPQNDAVCQFFLELYMSAAEPLPHEFKIVGGIVEGGSDGEEPAEIDEDWCPERSMPAVISALLGNDAGMPRRFISHNTLTNLYWLFVSTFSHDVPESESEEDGKTVGASETIPSFTTFREVWKTQWSKYLMLRKESQHAECRTCFEARQRLHKAGTSLATKLDIARQWKKHLHGQYLDRSIYWHCRFASRHKLGVLTVIIDSMDKAKFSWPQFPWHRVDKTLEGAHRPRLVLTAAMAHGFATCFFIADENVSHGASAFCDVLARVIEKVAEVSRRSGVPMPSHLVVQADNTVAQAKNNEANVFLAHLVSQHKFQTASMFHLIVGHTHEDIDQLFGVLLMLVLRRKKFQTKQDLAANIVEVMHPRAVLKKEELVVEVVEHVRDFGEWLEPLRVHLYNAFMNRAGIEAPHSFVYKMRRDLFSAEQAMLLGKTRSGDEHDVFCCVKTYMRDAHLQQPPVLVLPSNRVQNSGMPARPQKMLPRHPLSDKAKKDLRDLAAALRANIYNLQRGADALDALAAGPPEPVFPSSPWLESVVFDPRVILAPSGNELFPHLPDSSWHLMVRFKR